MAEMQFDKLSLLIIDATLITSVSDATLTAMKLSLWQTSLKLFHNISIGCHCFLLLPFPS